MPAPPEDTIYKVVTNQLDQFLVLPAVDAAPPGWSDTGHTGTHDSCLRFLKQAATRET